MKRNKNDAPYQAWVFAAGSTFTYPARTKEEAQRDLNVSLALYAHINELTDEETPAFGIEHWDGTNWINSEVSWT